MDLNAVERAYAVDGIDISMDDGISLWTPDELLNDMAREENSITMVRHGELSMPVAYAIYRATNYTATQNTIWIRKIGVDRFHRLRGVGRSLCQKVLEEARKSEARVRVFVPSHAVEAQKFFRACGMIAVSHGHERQYEYNGNLLFEKRTN